MESALHIKTRRIATAGSCMAALVIVGCGSSGDYKNKLRPAAPIIVTAYISDSSVSVSPHSFGAGPVNLVITNQSRAAQQVVFQSSGSSAGVIQRTGPINPLDTATLKVDVPTGRAIVKVSSGSIRPASVRVGAPRKSAQNELLQP